MVILTLNILGIFPYYFATTSSVNVALLVGFTVTTVYLIYSFYRRQEFAFTHMVPKTEYFELGVFTFFVEIVGIIIRTFSLGIRLMANIVCGHILLTIVSLFILKFSFSMLGPVQAGLWFAEM
jgi:F-type H+-transporting ATPase subunit a